MPIILLIITPSQIFLSEIIALQPNTTYCGIVQNNNLMCTISVFKSKNYQAKPIGFTFFSAD